MAVDRLRKDVWDEIELLLNFLNVTGIDASLQPSFGFLEADAGQACTAHADSTDDRQGDDDLEGGGGRCQEGPSPDGSLSPLMRLPAARWSVAAGITAPRSASADRLAGSG